MERASVYLTEKANTLNQAISFFRDKTFNLSSNERRLIFLAQLDFWDFEVESLIYCFQSFADRQKDWKALGSIEEKVRRNGLMIRQNILNKVSEKINLRNKWHSDYRTQVIAPIDLLISTVDNWNLILDECAPLLVPEKVARSAIECGAKVQLNLDRYKKHISQELNRELNEL